jgi:hypothetical protein
MPTNDYIPSEDSGFRDWATVFASHLTGNPPAYLLSPAQALSVQSAVDDFVAKYQIAIDPATRTKANIIAKDDARSIAETLCRQYAMIIKETPGISDEDKVNAGVRPPNPSKQPIDCPQTSPIVTIIGNTPGSQTLQYRDPTEPLSRARPFGASELQMFLAISETENAPLSQAKFIGKFTRNPISVEFTEADNGKFATYYGRWASVRGETGPWSLPVSMAIAA